MEIYLKKEKKKNLVLLFVSQNWNENKKHKSCCTRLGHTNSYGLLGFAGMWNKSINVGCDFDLGPVFFLQSRFTHSGEEKIPITLCVRKSSAHRKQPAGPLGLLAVNTEPPPHRIPSWNIHRRCIPMHTLVYPAGTLTHTWTWLSREVRGQEEAGGAFLEERELETERDQML